MAKILDACALMIYLAKIHKGELITADKDFKLIENEVKVVWVG